VLRGGSFNNNETNARCAFRNRNNPNNDNINNGFRVAASHFPPVGVWRKILLAVHLLPEMPCVHGCMAAAKQERKRG